MTQDRKMHSIELCTCFASQQAQTLTAVTSSAHADWSVLIDQNLNCAKF